MNIATVIGTEGGVADIAELVRRLTFNTLIGNADMHVKNWSVIHPDRRTATVAPACDFVSTVVYVPDEDSSGGSRGNSYSLSKDWTVNSSGASTFSFRSGSKRVETG